MKKKGLKMSANVGDTLIQLRKQYGLKQKELANNIGVTPTYLSLVEKNRTPPSLSILRKISDFYGITVTTILFKSIDIEKVSDSSKRMYIEVATPVVDFIINHIFKSK